MPAVESLRGQNAKRLVDLRKSKDIGGWAGHTIFVLRGVIASDPCEWTFTGYVGAFNDTFDFNAMPWGERQYWAEVVTRILGKLPRGQGFEIMYVGKRNVADGGKW